MQSRHRSVRPRPAQSLLLEALERRELLSGKDLRDMLRLRPGLRKAQLSAELPTITKSAGRRIAHPAASSSPSSAWFNPTQLRKAYGMDQLGATGAGQTIAIIGAFHNPNAFQDLHAFDLAFGLPDPVFTQVAQDGSQIFPITDPSSPEGNQGNVSWEMEASMDVQWAHAMAPGANILLVEANSASYQDLIGGAVEYARNQPGVSVISMSFGGVEFGTEAVYDSFFATPSNHAPITFVASAGDKAAPATFPAVSSNVVAVGGTTLTLNADGTYKSEVGWSPGGGGPSTYYYKPSYQINVMTGSTMRSAPDVSLVGNPNTGVAVYDSWDFGASTGWFELGGTSLSAPLFAGMLAVANQMRVSKGLSTLDGRNDTLPKLYNAPASDFHDITSGNNGYSAGPGYDQVTGIGSPIFNNLVLELADTTGTVSGVVTSDNNASATLDAGDAPLAGARVYVDANGNGVYDASGSAAVGTGVINRAIPDANGGGIYSTLTVSGQGGPITHLSVTLSITHPHDNELTVYLIAPDGTQVQLLGGLTTTAANFTSTTFDDAAATPITRGIAPFTGSYRPITPLAALSGKSANGTWNLQVIDGAANTTGQLNSWSLAITTAAEPSAVSGADGSYAIPGLTAGTYTARTVAPGTVATGPVSSTFNVHGGTSPANFLQMPTTFTAGGPNDIFYLWQDADHYLIGKGTTAANAAYSLPKNLVTSLSFNLTSDGATLYVDFSGTAPLPAGNITVNGGGLATSTLQIKGAGAALTNLTMTDTQIGPPAGSVINYSNLGTMILWDSTINYTGDLSTLQALRVKLGTYFYWN